MRFVEEEDERRPVRVPDLGQPFEQLGEQPEEKRRIRLRRANELLRREDVHYSQAARVDLQQIVNVQHRLAEEGGAALLIDLDERALNGADRSDRDIAVLGRELPRAVADPLQHRAKILQVEQQQPVVVGDLEHEGQHALLRGVQPEQPPEDERSEVGNRRTDRKPAAAEHVPEHHWTCRPRRFGHAGPLQPLPQLRRRRTGCREAGEIPFDVGEKDRHAEPREMLRQHLERDRLAGSSGAGDEAVPIRERRMKQHVLPNRCFRDNERFGHFLLHGPVAGRLCRGRRWRALKCPPCKCRPAEAGPYVVSPRCPISSLASSGPLPSSSCLKYTNTSFADAVSRVMVSPQRLMSSGE